MSELSNKYPVVKVPADFINDNYINASVSVPDKIDYPVRSFDNDLFDKYETIIGMSAAIGAIGLIYSFISIKYNDTFKDFVIWSTYSVIWVFIIVQVSSTNKLNKRNFESEYKKLKDKYSENEKKRSSAENLNSKIDRILSSTMSGDKKRLEVLGLKEQYFKIEKTRSTFNKKGLLEDFFLARLKSHFTNVNIETHVQILGYTPDFILSVPDLRITLIIEIDEPYSFSDLEPIHIDDSLRDAEFISNNIGVLRFTEKQIHISSLNCILCIESVIEIMKGKSNSYNTFGLKENGWTRSQSLKWIEEGYREAYLGIQKKKKRNDADNYLLDELGIEY